MSKPVEKVYVSDWQIEYRCIKCDHVVSHDTMFCSHGLCPHCGHKSPCNIMQTKWLAYRLLKVGRWWQFWVKPMREYRERVS